jgi:hypothetical protein
MGTNMKTPLPADFRPPMWATKEFRRALLMGLMGCAVIGWLVVDIAPKFNQKPVRAVRPVGPDTYVPRAAAPGQDTPVRYEGVLAKVKDGTPIDDQDEPYQYLVRALARTEPATLAKDAKSVDYAYYSKLTEELRGQTVKVTALFLQSNPIRVDGAPGGVNFIHRTYLMDPQRGDEGFVVDLLEAPGELEPKSVVGIDAVFLKLGTYEGKKGAVLAPLFVGKSLHLEKRERIAAYPLTHLSGGAVAGGGLVLMLVVLWVTSRMFKKSGPTPPKTDAPALSLGTSKS